MSNFKMTLTVFLITLASYSLYGQNKNVISFNVQPVAGQVVIQWKIIPEADTLSFEVERSKDTIKWEKISKVSIHSLQEYLVTDSNPGKGVIYYRIRQVDNKSSFYSTIKWVQISKTGELYIWPNPAKDVLHVKTPFVEGSLEIINTEGKLMQKITITDFITDLSVVRLAKGIYFIRIKHEKEIFVEKFVKE